MPSSYGSRGNVLINPCADSKLDSANYLLGLFYLIIIMPLPLRQLVGLRFAKADSTVQRFIVCRNSKNKEYLNLDPNFSQSKAAEDSPHFTLLRTGMGNVFSESKGFITNCKADSTWCRQWPLVFTASFCIWRCHRTIRTRPCAVTQLVYGLLSAFRSNQSVTSCLVL